MKIWVIDFESVFSDDYTLRKLTTEEYIRDPRFEALLMGVRTPEGVYHYVEQDCIAKYLSTIDWSGAAILCHHAQFDGLILSHHYGVKPAAWLDTLSMARLMLGNHVSVALSSLTKHYGLPDKSVPYDKFKGRRWAELPFDLRAELGDGCLRDCDLTWAIFQKLMEGFPAEELQTIDWTIRCFTEPQLEGDQKLFERLQVAEWARQDELLIELGVSRKDIGSNGKFTALLEAEGVEVEYKPGKNGDIPAFSKTDEFMKGLLEDDNERVATLAACRLDARSSINETRAGRLAGMASRGPLPIYLSYCGAHTTRWSGGDKVNFQNFPRRGDMRRGIRAPAGALLAVFDYAQIEARILNYVAGQADIVEAFATGRDLYSEGASRFYGRPINKKDNPTERHLGKVLELGCGYGLGWARLQATCRQGALGGPSIALSEPEARQAVQVYRSAHRHVTDYWAEGDDALRALAEPGGGFYRQWGPVQVRPGKIILPNGAPMLYELKWDDDKRSWVRRTRTGWRKMWGGSLVENVIQALARVVMSQAALRVKQNCGLIPKWPVHDELVYVLDVVDADMYAGIMAELKAVPDWLAGCPLDVEGGLGEVYGDIK